MYKNFIFVLGPQGSGKSTQAQKLAVYLNYRFISTGEMLRSLAQKSSQSVKKVAEFMKKGELVPIEIVEEVLHTELEKSDEKGFILDGYPRSISQLQNFLAYISEKKWKLEQVFYLKVSEDECLERIQGRIKEEKRPDETVTAIKKRLEIFQNETKPLLKEYYKLGVLQEVDGQRSVEEIQKDLRGRV